MFDLTKLLLRLIYYHLRLLGVLNIEIDLRTGRARCTRFAQIQATIMHFVGFLFLVQLFQSGLWSLLWLKSSELLHYFNLIMIILRKLCMYTSLLTQFCHRRRMVRLINRYRRLARKRPLVMRLWQRGIQHKCLSIAFTELMHIIIVIILVWRLKFSLVLCLVFVYLPVTFLDMVTFQFYFALLNAQVYNRLLNQELRSLFAEMMMLELLVNRRDALTIKCGSISDRLDAIAFEKSQLQQLIEDLIGMFGLQSLCVSAHYYVTLITLIFYTYNVIKLNRYNLVVGLFLAKFISHILGMYITSNVAFEVLDEHRETVSLLATFSTSGLRLDEHLEAACESFVLQLASNPLRLPVLRAFNIDQRNIIIMLSSVITYSLVIIEFDIENFRTL